LEGNEIPWGWVKGGKDRQVGRECIKKGGCQNILIKKGGAKVSKSLKRTIDKIETGENMGEKDSGQGLLVNEKKKYTRIKGWGGFLR